MKDLYDAARHLVWLTQFGLSVVLPPVLFLLGAVWLRKQWRLGHLGWVRARHGGCHRQPAQFIKGN